MISNRAIFLDRDGVINHPIFNPKTKQYEAPFSETDFKLFSGVIEALTELKSLNFMLFLVSNQPDYAKGKTTLENLFSVHKKMHTIFTQNNILFNEYYYCYHHPSGVVPEYSMVCECRKPGNFFLREAKTKYDLDMVNSWMIGDRDVDIYCGQSIGARTIMIRQIHPDGKSIQSKPDFKANDLQEAVKVIKKEMSYATN